MAVKIRVGDARARMREMARRRIEGDAPLFNEVEVCDG